MEATAVLSRQLTPDSILWFIRDDRKVQVFISDCDGITNISGLIAEALGYRWTPKGWVSLGGHGFHPMDIIASHLSGRLGFKKTLKYRQL